MWWPSLIHFSCAPPPGCYTRVCHHSSPGSFSMIKDHLFSLHTDQIMKGSTFQAPTIQPFWPSTTCVYDCVTMPLSHCSCESWPFRVLTRTWQLSRSYHVTNHINVIEMITKFNVTDCDWELNQTQFSFFLFWNNRSYKSQWVLFNGNVMLVPFYPGTSTL